MTSKIPRETLRAVFIREKPYHLAWPITFDEALADPLTLAVLETIARHTPAYSRMQADRARVGLSGPTRVDPGQLPAPVGRRHAGPVKVDRKRLAAGDRDD